MSDDTLLKYVTVDSKAAEADLEAANDQIAELEHQLSEARDRRAAAQRAIAIASGEASLFGSTGSSSRRSAAKKQSGVSQRVEHVQIVELLKENGPMEPSAIAEALGVGGRVVGGALRRKDNSHYEQGDDGRYMLAE